MKTEKWHKAYANWQSECLAIFNATHSEQFTAEDFDVCEDGTAFCGLRQLTPIGALPKWNEANYLNQLGLFLESFYSSPAIVPFSQWKNSQTAC